MAAEAEGLKAKAEEAKEELDKLADLQNLKAEVAFNSALAGAPAHTRAGGAVGVGGGASCACSRTSHACMRRTAELPSDPS